MIVWALYRNPEPDPPICGDTPADDRTGNGGGQRRDKRHYTHKYTRTQAAIAVFRGHRVRGQCFAGRYPSRGTTEERSLRGFMPLIMGDWSTTVTVRL